MGDPSCDLQSPLTSCVFSCIQTLQGDWVRPPLSDRGPVYSSHSDIIVNSALFMLQSVQL